MARYRVVAPSVLVRVPGLDQLVEQGHELPVVVPPETIERFLAKGFIEPVEEAPEVEAPEVTEKPLEGLTLAELRKLAADRGVEVAKGAKRDDLLAALAAPAVSGDDLAELLADAARRGIEVPDGVTDPDDVRALIEQ